MSDVILKVDHLTVRYTTKTPALTDVSLEVERGDFLGIIGPNGGGKSTLLKAILGLVKYQSGSIWIAPGERISYVPQYSTMEREFPISALEVILSAFLHGPAHFLHSFTKSEKDKAMTYLEQLGLKGMEKRQIGQLSGGECQKLLIARVLACEPSILLLDEPTASVDPQSREHIFNVLDTLAGKLTILLITHDTMAVSSHVKHLACLNDRLFYHGDVELDEDTLDSMYGCPVDLIAHGVPHRVLSDHHV